MVFAQVGLIGHDAVFAEGDGGKLGGYGRHGDVDIEGAVVAGVRRYGAGGVNKVAGVLGPDADIAQAVHAGGAGIHVVAHGVGFRAFLSG